MKTETVVSFILTSITIAAAAAVAIYHVTSADKCLGPLEDGDRVFVTKREGRLHCEHFAPGDRVCRPPIFSSPLYRPE
jgi:hypothetical protein